MLRWIVPTVAFWLVMIVFLRVAVVPAEECGDPSAFSLREAAGQAGSWIIRNQLPDGRYTYEYDASNGSFSNDYNVVRHAGVTMSLYQIAGKLQQPDAMVAADLGKDWMLDNLVSQGDWVALSNGRDAKLGAVALMTIALAERRLLTGDQQYDDVMRGLGNFMRFVQRPDGGFHTRWLVADNELDTVSTSRYYPGEALWALALLHEAFPAEGYDQAAWDAADFITLLRDDVEEVKWQPLNDHWGAYGLAEMAEWGLEDHHIAYARQLAGRFSLYTRFEAQREAGGISGWMRGPDQRAASLGTWVEGMAALWRLSTSDERLADIEQDIRDRSVCGAGILERRQQPEDLGGLIAGGWFIDDVTRMDDQQHAISGLMYTADALEGQTRREPLPQVAGNSP